MTAQLREALRLAVDHIEMDKLAISHCKDHAAITAALSQHEPVGGLTDEEIDKLHDSMFPPPAFESARVEVRNFARALLARTSACALSRDEIIDEISPESKNSADHDIAFAMRVLARTSAPAAEQAEPFYGHQFKEVKRGVWRCECGKQLIEQPGVTP